MVVTIKGIMEPEGECQDKRGEISLDARDGGKKTVRDTIEPERTTFKPSLSRAGTGRGAPE